MFTGYEMRKNSFSLCSDRDELGIFRKI
jgi:hypothetical protein